MSTFKQYTPEQLEKIERLRKESEEARLNKREPYTFRQIKAEDRVFVTVDGATIIGYVLSVEKGKFTVSTPYGVMGDLEDRQLRLRHYEDLSGVVIPEELKAVSLGDLLIELRCRRLNGGYFYDDDGYYKSKLSIYSDEQIRAELRTRPNIKSQKCSRIVKRHSVK